MAAAVASSRLSPVNFTPKDADKRVDSGEDACIDDKNDVTSDQILSGSLISRKLEFQNKKGEGISSTPIIVDFRRLLQSKSSIEVVPGIPNRELLHGVVALYDVSLSEMTPDVLYNTVCEKWARTIILLRDVKDALKDQEKRRERKQTETVDLETEQPNSTSQVSPDSLENQESAQATSTAAVSTPADDADLVTSVKKDLEEAETKDIFEPEEEKPSVFAEVFSDTEDEEGSDSEDEEEDFSKGFKTFLEKVKERKQTIQTHKGPLTPEHIGVEHRVVGALTFEKTYCKPSEKVVHLTVIAVRKKFQKWGIGKYLLSQLKDTSVVGPFDALVVHADNSAIEFFERYGFSDDLVLNSKWSELAEQFTNCTLMCYMPPFTNQSLTKESIPELDIIAMEKEIQKWREKSMDAYRAEVSCINRLRHEVIHLRALTCSQQQLIATLAAENEELRRERFSVEKEFLDYRLSSAKAVFNGIKQAEAIDYHDDDDDADEEDYGEEINSAQLLKELLAEAELKEEGKKRRYLLSQGSVPDGGPYDHQAAEKYYNVTHDFYQAMKQDSTVIHSYDVKMVTQAILPNSVLDTCKRRLKTLTDPHMVTKLYYCGTLERPERINSILKHGFSEEDFSHGEYGRGLYFSKYPSKAAQFSALGKLLIAEVGLGSTETVVKRDRTRSSPQEGADSIITPGRLSSSGDSDNLLCQEYIIFDANQAQPLYLIEYVPKAD